MPRGITLQPLQLAELSDVDSLVSLSSPIFCLSVYYQLSSAAKKNIPQKEQTNTVILPAEALDQKGPYGLFWKAMRKLSV